MRTVVLIDDLDPDRTKNVETVRFSIRGKEYEVDLSAKSQRELDEALAPFLAVARPVATTAGPKRSIRKSDYAKPSTGKSVESEMPMIRSWARDNGIEIGDRGRIPAKVVEQYYREAGK